MAPIEPHVQKNLQQYPRLKSFPPLPARFLIIRLLITIIIIILFIRIVKTTLVRTIIIAIAMIVALPAGFRCSLNSSSCPWPSATTLDDVTGLVRGNRGSKEEWGSE